MSHSNPDRAANIISRTNVRGAERAQTRAEGLVPQDVKNRERKVARKQARILARIQPKLDARAQARIDNPLGPGQHSPIAEPLPPPIAEPPPIVPPAVISDPVPPVVDPIGGGGGTIPGPATDTLQDMFPLDDPAAGGPTFEGFDDPGEDELSRLINERLASIVSGQGLPSTAAPGLSEAGQAGEQALTDLASGVGEGGQLFEFRKSLEEELAGNREAGVESLLRDLGTRRLTGGGAELGGRFDLESELRGRAGTELRTFQTDALESARRDRLDAATAGANIGLARRGQDIAAVQADLGAQLDAIQSATGRALGVGDLALRNLIAEQDFVQFLADDQFRMAQFLEEARASRLGDETGMIQLIMNFLGQLQQGQVA